MWNGARVLRVSILILKTLPSTSLLTLSIHSLRWCKHLWQYRVTAWWHCACVCLCHFAPMCKIRDRFNSAHHWIFWKAYFQRIDVPCQSKSFESVFIGIFCQLECLFTFDTQTYDILMQPIETYFHFSKSVATFCQGKWEINGKYSWIH